MLARARAKPLAARDAFDLVWSRKENSSLLINFILVLSALFSFRLRVICKRRVAEPSENSWLISDTAAFARTSIMGKSCSSKVEPHADMFMTIFYSAVDKNPQLNTLTYERSRTTRFERLYYHLHKVRTKPELVCKELLSSHQLYPHWVASPNMHLANHNALLRDLETGHLLCLPLPFSIYLAYTYLPALYSQYITMKTQHFSQKKLHLKHLNHYSVKKLHLKHYSYIICEIFD